jgi:small neutral amino acid transporter SnatA (MarC family)
MLALVAAVNPFRTALAVPRAGRSRRSVAELALLGGLVGGVGAVLVAWAGGPLLDALDVSGPAIRLAAGIVAGVAGLIALFRGPPPSEPSLPGRGAALVPVAVPLVATPALLLLAISAHSDRGFPVLLAALAIAVALLTLVAHNLATHPTTTLPADTAASAVPGASSVEPPTEAPAPPAPATPVADAASDADADAADTAAAPAASDTSPVEPATEAPAPSALATLVADAADPEQPSPTSVGTTIVLWASRLTAASLVAACVALVIDGVLAV